MPASRLLRQGAERRIQGINESGRLIVELNLTISGRLDEVLRKGLAGYQVPDMIEERLKSYSH